MPWCEDFGPTGVERWRGTLSIPRVVSSSGDDEVCLYPVSELKTLETEAEQYCNYAVTSQKQYLYPADAKSFQIELWIDIEKIDSRYLECWEMVNCPIEIRNGKLKLLLLVDHSTVLYSDEGRYCITSNVYPEKNRWNVGLGLLIRGRSLISLESVLWWDFVSEISL